MSVNILVVDDRPEGQLAIEAVLKNSGHNLVMASSGVEALKYLLDTEFAVILLDVQMPELNGFETAEIIKTREKSKDIPIIFMSAINKDEEYVYRGYEVGAVDYIMKPFDPYVLKSKVSIFVDLYLKNKKLLEQSKTIYDNEIRFYAQALDRLELQGLRKYQYLADSLPQIVFRLLPDGSHEYFNKVWFRFTGFSIERSQGKGWMSAFHPDDLLKLLSVMGTDSEAEVECRILAKNGEFRWHLLKLKPEKYSGPHQLDAWLGTATDIEERKRNEIFQSLLSRAGKILVSSLTYKETFEDVAKLIVSEIADGCRFEVINSSGVLEEAASVSGAPLPCFDSSRCFEEKTPVFVPRFTEGHFAGFSLIIVPLLVQDKAVGALTLAKLSASTVFDEAHLELAEELGRRAAMAFENSLLYSISQQAIKARNDFLSIASHELNTPITSLKLQLQLMKRSLDKNDQVVPSIHRSVSGSIRQVDRLINLVNILLDVSQIQSGRFQFSFSPCRLDEVVSEVVERYQEMFTATGCELNVSTVPKISVNWDRMRMEQVLVNLLVNATKYAPGKIDLDLSLSSQSLKIEVRDYGKGIPADKIKSIFERFSRANSESVAGLGLGLYIVREIVEGHGGVVSVQSSSKGSIFQIILPLENKESGETQIRELEESLC